MILARLGSGCYCLTKPLLADIFSEMAAAGEVGRHCAVRGDILRPPPPVKFPRRLKCSAGPSGESRGGQQRFLLTHCTVFLQFINWHGVKLPNLLMKFNPKQFSTLQNTSSTAKFCVFLSCMVLACCILTAADMNSFDSCVLTLGHNLIYHSINNIYIECIHRMSI